MNIIAEHNIAWILRVVVDRPLALHALASVGRGEAGQGLVGLRTRAYTNNLAPCAEMSKSCSGLVLGLLYIEKAAFGPEFLRGPGLATLCTP